MATEERLLLSPALSFSSRAALPTCPPLNAYLLNLMTIKRSNLCLSADVTTASELLSIAEELGDIICLLKTHADIVIDWSDRTANQLKEIANRKHFLIFEDRKFADIGSTVQKQYSAGPLGIARWAELVTVHVLPGPAIVTALKHAARSAICSYNTVVHTEISAGSTGDIHDCENKDHDEISNPNSDSQESFKRPSKQYLRELDYTAPVLGDRRTRSYTARRKNSIVSISTTISTRSEPASPIHSRSMLASMNNRSNQLSDRENAFAELGPIPYLRSCLLLAQMSSEDNFIDEKYTNRCFEIGRQHRDFVLGFISQKSLNRSAEDNFLTLTPGVKLAEEESTRSDNLGQQYRTPSEVVLQDGTDIIIVGRGILGATHRLSTAERYREEAWQAYTTRIGLPS